MARGGGGRIGNSGNGNGNGNGNGSSSNSNFPLFGFIAGQSLVNSGGGTLSVCNADDDTFYCELVRGFNILKMFLFIIFILFMVGYGIYYFTTILKFSSSSRRGSRK
jgi:hypothetical protein